MEGRFEELSRTGGQDERRDCVLGKGDLWQTKLECLERAAEMADGQRSF